MTEIIDPRHLLVRVATILERLRIDYAVTGGMAVFVWGRPRFTADIDIVVLLQEKHLDGLVKSLEELSEASFISREAVLGALERHGEFNFIDGASGVKVDFWVLGKRPFAVSQLRRRISRLVLGEKVYFVAPEDLILSKLIWYKESSSSKQLEDIESVVKIQKKLDWKYLNKWAKIQSTYGTLKQIRTRNA